MKTFIATITPVKGEEYEIKVEGESAEIVGEYLCNCGELNDDDMIASIEEAK